jgi:hypothetical protein
LADTTAILLANHLIEPEEMLVLRLVSAWLHQVRVPSGLGWRRRADYGALLSGQSRGSRGWLTPLGTSDRASGGDRAMRGLAGLRQHFGRLHQLPRWRW